eukprot:5654557-Amphidinium_carterae.1
MELCRRTICLVLRPVVHDGSMRELGLPVMGSTPGWATGSSLAMIFSAPFAIRACRARTAPWVSGSLTGKPSSAKGGSNSSLSPLYGVYATMDLAGWVPSTVIAWCEHGLKATHRPEVQCLSCSPCGPV